MMSKKLWLSIFVVFFTILLLYSGFGSLSRRFDDMVSFSLNDQIKKQRSGKRIWKDVEARKILTIGYNLFIPLLIKVDKLGNIYVVDYGDMKVKKFSSSGRFEIEFGKGKGQGPSEFLNPTDIEIDDSLNLWVSDAYNVRISVFNRDGSLKKIFKLDVLPYRILSLNNGKFLVQRLTDFGIYDFDGRVLFKFTDEFIQKKFSNPLYWHCYLESDNTFLYCLFGRLGYLVCLNLNGGRVKYRIKTIDDFPEPKLVVTSSDGAKVTKLIDESPFLIFSMNMKGNVIFSHGYYIKGKKDKVTVIDAYSTDDGKYLYSFKIPEKFKYGYFDGRYYYGVEDTSISKWEVIFK